MFIEIKTVELGMFSGTATLKEAILGPERNHEVMVNCVNLK